MRKILSHEFAVLVGLAGLKSQLKSDQNKDRNFAANWAIAAEWSPEYRYELIDPMSAQMLVRAISAPQSGVLEWIKSHW